MKNRIVIAIGGNALGNSPTEQHQLVRQTARFIVDLIEAGNQIILTHGNGPQVGMISLAMEEGAGSASHTPEMPIPECGAMSQGYIGYHLQNALREELQARGIRKSVASVVSQVLVDKDDAAFQHPTKPIGPFFSAEEAEQITARKGYVMIEDSGRGYRRVVPSPMPVDVIEKDIVRSLVEQDHVVITVGGGGIPVIQDGNRLVGVTAVIDKDAASEKLAEIIDANYLVILTAVERVAINFGKPDQQWLSHLTVPQAAELILEGHFAPGSMLPKVEAAVRFARSRPGRRTLITSLEKVKDGLEGRTGTVISDLSEAEAGLDAINSEPEACSA